MEDEREIFERELFDYLLQKYYGTSNVTFNLSFLKKKSNIARNYLNELSNLESFVEFRK